jgi:AP-3 complex subunit delta-1
VLFSPQVKGIRAHKDKGEAEYIASCVAEIKNELASNYPDVKAMALRKLIYVSLTSPR